MKIQQNCLLPNISIDLMAAIFNKKAQSPLKLRMRFVVKDC